MTLLYTELAYIGPGAGFAFAGSFLALVAALCLVLCSLLALPVRIVVGWLRQLFGRRRPWRRVVVLGIDGMDPGLARGFMSRGLLPHFSRLAEDGAFVELESTCPPMSPVAWSTFSTGTNPGKHGIFDFLGRDLNRLQIELSSSRVETGRRGRVSVQARQGSEPFWHALGRAGVGSTVLRVPITFPPKPFRGQLLSAMCTPDLRGTQGTFSVYRTVWPTDAAVTGGERRTLDSVGEHLWRGVLIGPEGRCGPLELPFELEQKGETIFLRVERAWYRLATTRHTPWVEVSFRDGRRRVKGICRFLLTGLDPLELYVTPINLHPLAPAMPISHPRLYASYLALRHGHYATLGLAEDTWGHTEGVLDAARFLEQVRDIHAERRAMFLHALRTRREGLVCCVFDLADRVQHLFLRQDGEQDDGVVADVYRMADKLLGETLSRLGRRDLLLVLSDHGFRTFRRCVNLNAWLRENGYLAFKEGVEEAEHLGSIDWAQTRAYSFGLSGIYLNMAGREAEGVVSPSDASSMVAELIERLSALVDPETGEGCVTRAYDARQVYRGPYVDRAPDVVVGFADGYRSSWENAVGRTDGPVFSDNMRPWGGDHCMDRSVVPGVLFSNCADFREVEASMEDIAPTCLEALGVPIPSHVDGQSLWFKLRKGASGG